MKASEYSASEVASYYRARFPDLKQAGPEWRGGCPVHEGFDPLSDEFLADPYAVMATVDEPVFYAPSLDYYVVTRYGVNGVGYS